MDNDKQYLKPHYTVTRAAYLNSCVMRCVSADVLLQMYLGEKVVKGIYGRIQYS
jgi:hypothetical protein